MNEASKQARSCKDIFGSWRESSQNGGKTDYETAGRRDGKNGGKITAKFFPPF